MPENFFEPGKKSHCLFSPDLWCDVFNPSAPFSPFDFLCDITPQLVGVVLPAPEGEAGELWERIYREIEQVWQRRQIGFHCQRIDLGSWTLEKPCEACALMREAQVVVIDFQGGDLRAGSFRDMAAGSNTSLQVLRALGGTTPTKRVILISCGKSDLPPHYRKVFDWIDYTGPDGQPDLDKLSREMAALAGQDLFQSGDAFRVGPEEFGAEPPGETGAAIAVAEERGEIPITLIGETTVAAPPLLQRTPEERLAEAISAAERLARQGKYAAAFQALQEPADLRVADRGGRLGELEREYVSRLGARDIADLYFRGLTSSDHGRFELFAWEGEAIAAARMVLQGEDLSRLLGTRELTLCACDRFAQAEAEELQLQLLAHPQRARALVVLDDLDDAICRRFPDLRYDQVFEIHLADLRRWLLERKSPLDLLRDRLCPGYRRQEDLFLRNLHGPVDGERDFFGRGDLLARLQERLLSGDSFAVYGLPQSGKSSLLWRLARLPLPGPLLAVVDLQGYSPDRPAELYARTARAVREAVVASYARNGGSGALDPAAIGELFTLPAGASLAAFRGCFEADIKALIAAIRGRVDRGFKRLVLLFDDIEAALTEEHQMFLTHLQSLMAQNGSLAIGMSGLGFSLKRELSNVTCPLRGVQEHVLGGLSPEECRQMVTRIGHRMYRYFDAEALARIVRESGGHPQLTRYLCSLVLEGAPAGSPGIHEAAAQQGAELALATENLRRRLERIFGGVERHFRTGADLLQEMARETAVPDGAGVELSRLEQRTRLQRNALEMQIRALDAYGLVETAGDQLKPRIGLLHRWLRQQAESEP